MAKKALHIILSAIMLISTIGITINKHYSGGELFSIAFWSDADSCCEIPCDCCTNTTVFFHLDTDYLSSSSCEISLMQEVDVLIAKIILLSASYTKVQTFTSINYLDDTSPTYTNNPPAFLQTFRC